MENNNQIQWSEVKKIKFHHRVKRFYYKNLFRKIYTAVIIWLIAVNIFSIVKYQSFADEIQWWEWSVAQLVNGYEFNSKLIQLVWWYCEHSGCYDDNGYIKVIKKYDGEWVPDTSVMIPENNVSLTPDYPVYVWYENDTIYYYTEAETVKMNTDSSQMFQNLQGLTDISSLANWDTSSVTNMSNMFNWCQSLTELDLSSWDTSSVTNMRWMFSSCESLTELDLSSWDTSSVTDMEYMFSNCGSLTKIDLSNWDTSSVIDMYRMFDNCQSLTELDLSSWDTSSVTNMEYMFSNCTQLKTIYVKSFDRSSVNWRGVFYADWSDMSAPYDSYVLFDNTPNLVWWNGTNWSSSRSSILYARIDGDECLYPPSGYDWTKQPCPWYFTPPPYHDLSYEWVNDADFIFTSAWTYKVWDEISISVNPGWQVEKVYRWKMSWDIGNVEIVSSSDTELVFKMPGFDVKVTPVVEEENLECPLWSSVWEDWNCKCDIAWAVMRAWECSLSFRKNGVDYYPMSVNLWYTEWYEEWALYKWWSDYWLRKDEVISQPEWTAIETSDWSVDNQWPCPIWYHVPSWDELTKMTSSYAGNWQRMMNELNFQFAWYRNTYGQYKPTAKDVSWVPDQSSDTWKTRLWIYFWWWLAWNNVYNVIIFDGIWFYTRTSNSWINKENWWSVRCFKNNDEKYVTIHWNGWEPRISVWKIEWDAVILPEINREWYKLEKYTTDAEWNNEYDTTQWATDEIVLYAQWKKLHTITWQDSNGETIETTEVGEWDMPLHDVVEKSPTAEYTYTWKWWEPELVPVTEPTSYRATYTAKANSYTISFDTDGWDEVAAMTLEYWAKILSPETNKSCNKFVGWEWLPETMPAKNITVKAKWEYTCNRWSWWGWKKSSTEPSSDKDTHGSAETPQSQATAPLESGTQESANDGSPLSRGDTASAERGSLDMESYDPSYSLEMNQVYQFAKANWITTMDTIKKANMWWKLTRIQMAKMLSYYAINVLWQTPDTSKWVIRFKDVTKNMNKQYDNWVTLAYELWIMWQNMKKNRFRPYDEVTRAEFTTALSRMIYGIEDGTWKTKYYIPHMAKLYNEWIISKMNPNMKEKRWYVMLMLMRSIE